MNFFKKIFSLTLCIVLCAVLSITAFAAATPQITISNERALSGEEVTVNITLTNNPGIMSMTFSVKYDKDNFEFVDCAKGFTNTPYYKDHSEKGYIIFSISDSSDNISNGNLLSLTFRIKDTATPGKYPITLANQDPEKNGNKLHNCFSNQKENFIIPDVKAGSITVACSEAGHNYGEWNTIKGATCTQAGEKNRICSNCGDVETEVIPITDHNFEADWTVDKAATPEEDGIMSRHCANCDAVTDEITFSYEEIGGDDEENTSSDQSSSESTSSNTSSEQGSNSQGTSSNSGSGSKPNINNTVGEKNPQSEVEKLEKYPEINNDKEQNNSSEQSSSEQNSTPTDNNSSNDVTTDADVNTEEPSFFSTTTGIVVLVICILLSLGILAFGIILILRNKKSQ